MLYHVYDVWQKFYFEKWQKYLKFSESKFSISGQTCDKANEGAHDLTRDTRAETGRVGGGGVAERLERWTCNSEAPSRSPVLTASWICSLWPRVQILDRACKQPTALLPASWDS